MLRPRPVTTSYDSRLWAGLPPPQAAVLMLGALGGSLLFCHHPAEVCRVLNLDDPRCVVRTWWVFQIQRA